MSQHHPAVKNVLTAKLADVSSLASLLRSVYIQNHAVVIASEHGLEMVTELNRTLQAHAYLYSNMFEEYQFTPVLDPQTLSSALPNQARRKPARHDNDLLPQESTSSDGVDSSEEQQPSLATQEAPPAQEPPSVSFELNLQTWISCLNIFGGGTPLRPGSNLHAGSGFGSGAPYRRTRDGFAGSHGSRDRDREPSSSDSLNPAAKATRMTLSYQGIGHPLILELDQEANVVTRCALSTYEPSFLTDMTFDSSQLVGQVILASDLLHSAFSEIDSSCKKLSIHICPSDEGHPTATESRPSMLRFTAISDIGSTEMEFPVNTSASDPRSAIEKFLALPESQEQWYDFGAISKTLTVLRNSIKTSIRIDVAGLLSFQFMMPKYDTRSPAVSNVDQEHAFVEFLCIPLDETTLIV